MASTSTEERKVEEPSKEMAHKTKVIEFLGRTTPIILQNDNGPCPLLAVCNVLLLKNQLNLSSDIAEVSQEKLLSLVAERLIDSNSNVNNKDAGYVENQQQNIADAIDLLPRLTTGIDVNIKFRRIDDFEFTRECAIFDLLDIPLYHGWIVDPQDYDTSNAIGSRSYNALMGELVALDTQNMDHGDNKNVDEDDVDFVAATTATLGVPSPCVSRVRSFGDSPRSVPNQPFARKGDIEEQEELLKILKLSEVEVPNSVDAALVVNANEQNLDVSCKGATNDVLVNTFVHLNVKETLQESGNTCQKPSLLETSFSKSEHINVKETLQESGNTCQKSSPLETSMSNSNDVSICNNDLIISETVPFEATCSSSTNNREKPADILSCEDSDGHVICKDDEKVNPRMMVENRSAISSSNRHGFTSSREIPMLIAIETMQIKNESTVLADRNSPDVEKSGFDTLDNTSLATPPADSDLSSDQRTNVDSPEIFTPDIDSSEPIYEGEECISGTSVYEDREPMYEGEVVLAEQVDKASTDAGTNCKENLTPKEGELIRNFLKNSASQLTVYGLFCLQDGLKERELCVFFRNNHFNTMFKLEGELYILATDQGYISQPYLVWEKLNEVNGNTQFMTSSFKEFKVDNQSNGTWDEQNALASTSDYLASFDNLEDSQSSFNSDLQLAIALQQQEFEQQSQRTVPQPSVPSASRLVTGPQVPRNVNRNSSSAVKPETKSSKEKCIIM